MQQVADPCSYLPSPLSFLEHRNLQLLGLTFLGPARTVGILLAVGNLAAAAAAGPAAYMAIVVAAACMGKVAEEVLRVRLEGEVHHQVAVVDSHRDLASPSAVGDAAHSDRGGYSRTSELRQLVEKCFKCKR